MKRIPVLSVAVLLAMCLAACALPEEFSEKIGAAASVAEDSAYTQGETGTEADTETATEAAAVAPPPDGSFTTDRLTVTEKNGVYYMNFVNGNTPNATVEGCQMGEILFDSVDAFYAAARGVDSSHENTIKTIFSRTEDGILTVNTARLYCPALPDGTVGSLRAYWQGSKYGYFIYPPEGKNMVMTISCTDIAAYRVIHPEPTADPFGWFSRNYDELFDPSTEEGKDWVHTETTFEGVPCKMITKTNEQYAWHYIRLTVQDGDRTVTAFIDYEIPVDATGPQSEQNVSELVPYDIFLRWCDEKDAVTVFIQHVDEVVTSEWLRSVRLALYNPNQGNP